MTGVNMKEISLKVVDFYGGRYPFESTLLHEYLHSKYKIVYTGKPDIVVYSTFGYEHLKYKDSIRIFFAGENLRPDFNVADFALSYDHMEFGDRNLWCPFHHMYNFKMLRELSNPTYYDWNDDLSLKTQ